MLLKNTIFEAKPYNLSMKKLFLLLLIILSNNVFGCSCDGTPTVKESLHHSKEVFIAKITSIDSTHLSDYGQKIYLYDIKIIHFFKKDPHNRSEEIRTLFYRKSPGLCDFKFIPGEKYLIYEDNGERNYEKIMDFAITCPRTALLTHVEEEEINELEKLSKTSFKDDLNIDDTSGVSNKEYSNLITQPLNIKTASEKIKYLIIISALLFITTLVFGILYIKTNRKLKHYKNL